MHKIHSASCRRSVAVYAHSHTIDDGKEEETNNETSEKTVQVKIILN